jgi:superoxide dismutase, Cu-Zn family
MTVSRRTVRMMALTLSRTVWMMALTLSRTVWMMALTLSLSGCRLPYIPQVTPAPPAAAAQLTEAGGRVVGRAVFLQEGGGVRILIDVAGLPPGTKAVHIHEKGRCDPPSFESAGGHFNPDKREHGTSNPRGSHAGDLTNITVDDAGRGHLEVTATRVSLDKGPTFLFDADGSALIVHEGPDDLRTDPDGKSGARVACGIIVPGQ